MDLHSSHFFHLFFHGGKDKGLLKAESRNYQKNSQTKYRGRMCACVHVCLCVHVCACMCVHARAHTHVLALTKGFARGWDQNGAE